MACLSCGPRSEREFQPCARAAFASGVMLAGENFQGIDRGTSFAGSEGAADLTRSSMLGRVSWFALRLAAFRRGLGDLQQPEA